MLFMKQRYQNIYRYRLGMLELAENLFIPFADKENYIKKRYREGCLSVNYFENSEVINRLKLADEVWLASSWKS